MNRRRFLKYAGVTAAVVGASALGLGYSAKSFSPKFGQTSTSSSAARNSVPTETTSIATSLHTTDMELTLFADWHGDGEQQTDEPTIDDLSAEITGIDVDYNSVLLADSDGTYWARNIPVGKQYRIVPKTDKFRFIAISNSQFVATKDYNYIAGSSEPSLHLGLMEGFLTLPMMPATKYDIDRFYDHDPDPQKYLWWTGVTGYDKYLPRGYSPNHPGIDYMMQEGNLLVSPAPGVVESVGEDPGGKYIFIKHTNDLKTSCGHISSAVVKEGNLVARGQTIAISGKSGKNTELANYPHNHFMLIYRGRYAIDPYAPQFSMAQQYSGYYDASKTDPTTGNFPWIALPINDQNPNLKNYWTKRNDPKFAGT